MIQIQEESHPIGKELRCGVVAAAIVVGVAVGARKQIERRI